MFGQPHHRADPAAGGEDGLVINLPGKTVTPKASPVATRSERALGIALAVFCGTALAVQSRINGELGIRLADGVLAALISFGTGLVLLVVVVPLVPRARRGVTELRTALRSRDLAFWQCLGGKRSVGVKKKSLF